MNVMILVDDFILFMEGLRKAMIGLSQTTGYAVQALCCLEDGSCNPRLIRDIARCTGIPKPYLAKIVNQLSHKGIITTKRGYRGGIVLAHSADELSLLDVVEAIEGRHWIGECLLGMDDFAAQCVCPTTQAWKQIRNQIEDLLRATKLGNVIRCMVEKQVQPAPPPALTCKSRRRCQTQSLHGSGKDCSRT